MTDKEGDDKYWIDPRINIVFGMQFRGFCEIDE